MAKVRCNKKCAHKNTRWSTSKSGKEEKRKRGKEGKEENKEKRKRRKRWKIWKEEKRKSPAWTFPLFLFSSFPSFPLFLLFLLFLFSFFSSFPDLLVELSEPQKCKSVKVEKYTFTSVKMHIFENDTKTQFLSKNVKNPEEKHPPQQCIL